MTSSYVRWIYNLLGKWWIVFVTFLVGILFAGSGALWLVLALVLVTLCILAITDINSIRLIHAYLTRHITEWWWDKRP